MMIRNFASTDLDLFPVGMGTVQIGMAYGLGFTGPPSESECTRVLQFAHDNGINYFDTAPAYGRSELVLGKAFASMQSPPIIATKVLLPDPPWEDIGKFVEESVANSLKLLHLDCILLLQLHSALTTHLVPELFECMEQLTSRGLVRHWGTTVYEEADAEAIVASGKFSTLQVPFNVIDQRMRLRLFPSCLGSGMGLVFRSVFLKGILSHRHTNLPPELAKLQLEVVKMDAVARAAGITLAELAFRFAAFAPFDQVTLFGSTSIEETAENLELVRRGPLGDDVISALAELAIDDELLEPVYTTPGWTIP